MLYRNLILFSVVTLLICVAGSEAYGQFGSISGRVIDERGDPVSGAIVYVPYTLCLDMTDKTGHYLIPFVPSGRHRLRIYASGYLPTEKPQLTVAPKKVLKSDFVLKMEPEEPVARWRPTAEVPRYTDDLSEVQRDSLLNAIALKAGLAKEGKTYRDNLRPVLWQKLEFHVRYTIENKDDSTLVRVFADGTNVSEDTVDICGVFSFLKRPHSLSFQGMTRTYNSPVLNCRILRLGPGDAIVDTVQFSYGRDRNNAPQGEIGLWCWFFRGADDVLWEETDSVDLGILEIPVK